MKTATMIRTAVLSVVTSVAFMSTSALAADLSPANLVGNYTVKAEVFFQKITGNFTVFNEVDFEFQRTYPDGKADEICGGKYTFSGKSFKGLATCPSDRSKTNEFDVDFANNAQTEDLTAGTTVKIRASNLGNMRVNAFVKRR